MSKKNRLFSASLTPADSLTLHPGDFPSEGHGHRQLRLEHILLHELQSLLRDEASDPSLEGVTLLAVHLSPDGGHARIAYAVLAPLQGEQFRAPSTKTGLGRATGFLRARLAQQLNLKKLPKLSFTFVGILQVNPDEEGGGACQP